MPYEWIRPVPEPGPTGHVAPGSPPGELHLWPYRSLPKRGFVTFIGITAAMCLFPLLAVIGTVVVWTILPFFLLMLGSVWFALQRSYADGAVLEELRLWPDRVELRRVNPRGPEQQWEANPYWVQVAMHPKAGPVENYITLSGSGREVEIGAFLSAEEREALYADLTRHFGAAPAPR